MTGKTFSKAGQAGINGTMPDNAAVTIVPTTTNQTIALGYHDGSGYVEGDADLVADKIKQGVDMFGVTGTVIEATGDATAANVLTGKTFSNASAAGIAGTMPDNGAVTIVPTTTNQAIAAGYHDGLGYVEGDADLVAGSIARGVDLFGVTGICRGVRATGQTGCWDQGGSSIACAGTGQDGEYQLGCRPGVYPSPGSKGFNRGFTANGDGTVTDNLTGLVWLENANCSTFFSGDSTGQNYRTWSNALTAANSLANGYCGLSDGSSAGDWRLPHINELSSLVDPAQMNPALPAGHPFINVQPYVYWSSTTRAGSPGNAWGVFLSVGLVDDDDKDNDHWVWPARGGQ